VAPDVGSTTSSVLHVSLNDTECSLNDTECSLEVTPHPLNHRPMSDMENTKTWTDYQTRHVMDRQSAASPHVSFRMYLFAFSRFLNPPYFSKTHRTFLKPTSLF
jgi:hypothetical protein